MPGPLKNERHERMAQEMAKGTDQAESHRLAGGSGKRAAACMIARRPEVRARVAELQERAAAKTEVTIASVTDRLLKIADKAEKGAMGAAGLSVSRQAMMDAAKLNGLIVEKTKTEITNPDGSLRPTLIRIVAADDRSGTEAPA